MCSLNRSKTNSLGRIRRKPLSAHNPTPDIDRLDVDLGYALEKHRNNPTKENLRKAIVLENKVNEARKSYELQKLLNLLDQLQDLHQLSKIRLFYKEIRMKSKNLSDPSFVIWNPKSDTSNPVFSSNKEDYLEFWTQYLTKAFSNQDFPKFKAPEKIPSSDNADQPLNKTEINSAIQMMKNFKAPGFDEITNEDIKLIEHLKPDLIHSVLQRIWESETCPDEFRRSIIYLFPKPSNLGKEKDHRFQKNDRPISLLPTLRKLYEVILSSRLLNILKLNKTQFGFLKGKSTSDCIFLLI